MLFWFCFQNFPVSYWAIPSAELNFWKNCSSLICKSHCVEQLIVAVSQEYNSENDT